MKFRFLLLLTFTSGLIRAQCDYPDGVDKTLIITEARFIDENWTYLELTNVGPIPIFMSNFKIGKLSDLSYTAGILDLCNDPWWMISRPGYIFLPEKVLMPGKSWVITTGYDFGPEYYKEHKGRLGGNERPKNPEWYDAADKVIHRAEPIDGVNYPGDSVTTPYNDPEQVVKRGNYTDLFSEISGGTFFIEHHYSSTDSAVVDQVGGFFDAPGGRNIRGKEYSIAGVNDALGTSVAFRKNTITSGNLDFANSVGISIDESDWMPIQMPAGHDHWRDLWWTIGNHGNYLLDENTLEPTLDGIIVDFAGKKITLPWGIRRLDDIMRNMRYKPGIAWNYVLNYVKGDSLYRSARTGDKLIVYAVGNTLTTDTFDIVVNEPSADDNIVIPIDHRSVGFAMTPRAQHGILDWPRVTKHGSVMDTITGRGFGLEYGMRLDTLIKYLELPDKATWEIDWVDGRERADLKNGDVLMVTSESGIAKEYFIQVQPYMPSDNASLSAITWPDIPARYRDVFGWTGDTIPTFSPETYSYQLVVPFDVDGIPALIPTTFDYNATIETKRAKSVSGLLENRTIEFTVTAEDGITKSVYTIELTKEKHPDDIEPIELDPFYSEFVNQYRNRVYVEIYNPGTLPIDLRNYAFAMDKYQPNPYGIIETDPGWERRYSLYIPGLKYVDSLTWQVSPKMMIQDINVNPILQPGDCFVMAKVGSDYPDYDVSFTNAVEEGFPNPWNENVEMASSSGIPMPPNGNRENSMFIFKVLNDSVQRGLKPIADSSDFKVIDVWGMEGPNFSWIVGDYVLGDNEHNDLYRRKPWIYKGNPIPGGAFAPGNTEACEWNRIKPSIDYADLPNQEEVALEGIGSHDIDPITDYKSTVNSFKYQVSPGYGHDEEVMGIVTGTTIPEFLNDIYKEDENQTLTFTGSDTTTVLADNSALSMNDMLVVLSADTTMTTYYRLDVTDEGLVLSADAVLTSNSYSIDISVAPNPDQVVIGEATITGIEYGTTLEEVMNNIIVPDGARVTFIDADGGYVAYNKLNYDTIYVPTTVSPEISIDVLAENGQTELVYNLMPNSTADDAFIRSDVYLVSQDTKVIKYIQSGLTFSTFINNLIIPDGATLKLYDKHGLERTSGKIKVDDKVVVTSANGTASCLYYLIFTGESNCLIFGIDEITACNSYTWIDGVTYAESNNIATYTISNPAGCDSLVTLDLTINKNTATDVITTCGSYTWIDGVTYTESNSTATFTINNPAGCDTLVMLDLSINNSTTGTDVIAACNSFTWIDGITYTESNNTATITLTNAAGCDSVVTLDLTINTSTTGTDVISACDSYTWIDGVTHTESNNTATHTLTNAAGCDSMVTLDLTINRSYNIIYAVTACDSYTWTNGVTYTESNNTATHTLTSAAGCDSVITIDLTINKRSNVIYAVTACDSYTWINGVTYTESNNTATHTLTNSVGCDSIIKLDLTLNESSTSTINEDIASGSSYTAPDGNTYSTNGTYTAKLENAAGCDSVISINLNVITDFSDITRSTVFYYPNPVHDDLTIEFNQTYSGIVKVVNISGQVIFEKVIDSQDKMTLNTSILCNGIYTIHAVNSQKSIIFKIIKN